MRWFCTSDDKEEKKFTQKIQNGCHRSGQVYPSFSVELVNTWQTDLVLTDVHLLCLILYLLNFPTFVMISQFKYYATLAKRKTIF
jgi:hypothetical protein